MAQAIEQLQLRLRSGNAGVIRHRLRRHGSSTGFGGGDRRSKLAQRLVHMRVYSQLAKQGITQSVPGSAHATARSCAV